MGMAEVKVTNVTIQRESLDAVINILDSFFPYCREGVESSGNTVIPHLGYQCNIHQEYIVEGSIIASLSANLVQGQSHNGRYVGSFMLNIPEEFFEKVLASLKSHTPEVYTAVQSVSLKS